MVPSTTDHLYIAAREYETTKVEAEQAMPGRGNDDGRPGGWVWFAVVAGVSLGLWALIIWGATTLYRLL